jgi:hypothetical protein
VKKKRYFFEYKSFIQDYGCGTMVESMPGMSKALGSISGISSKPELYQIDVL